MSLSIRVYSLIITNETYLEAWKNLSICSTVAYFNLINFILKDEEFKVVDNERLYLLPFGYVWEMSEND